MGILRREKRDFTLNAATSVLANGIAALQSNAGVSVTEENALKYSAVYACARVLAEDVASLPLVVYKRLTPRGKERAPQHPLHRLLHDQPNPEMTSFQFRETLMLHLALWGNAYAEIEWADGRPHALWPITPKRVRVDRDADGGLRYNVLPPSGGERVFRGSQIFHVPGLSHNGVTGMSPISAAREAIGLGLAAEEFGARFFSNDARPGAVIEHPASMSDKAFKRVRAAFEDRHRGLAQSHRVAILEEGMKLHEVGIPPEDAQFLETRQFQTREIARFYRMQPHKIGDLSNATFSNIEHQAIEHVVDTVRPWLVRWEQAIAAKLMPVEERPTFFAEFIVDGLLRGDTVSRYQAYAVGRQWGWLSADDIRELENMNPLPDGQGSKYLVPLNMTTPNAPAPRSADFPEPVTAGA